ncbi:MAG: class I SAM-dependent methyltransferase [Planctomycetota bacterium]
MDNSCASMTVCNVCRAPLGNPIYRSEGEQSLTSLCTLRAQRTVVRFCGNCGHVQTDAILHVDQFYANEYDILIQSDDEDQLYEIRGEQRIFRVPHQLDTLLSICKIPHAARVLDFGCAKGAMAKSLLAERPDLQICLFDVSERYRPFWNRFLEAERTALGAIPENWSGRFDLIYSFFVLEHVTDLVGVLDVVRRSLKPGGTFYFLVPNLQANIADLVVVDHCNHFTRSSLEVLLENAGFESVLIDEQAHSSAFVVRASRSLDTALGRHLGVPRPAAEIELARLGIESLCDAWRGMGTRIRDFESRVEPEEKVAVYGSGFYGAFLTTCLSHPDRMVCYVDRNPFRQKRNLLGKPILAPAELPPEVRVVYVGLNPALARSAIADVREWLDRPLRFFYL